MRGSWNESWNEGRYGAAHGTPQPAAERTHRGTALASLPRDRVRGHGSADGPDSPARAAAGYAEAEVALTKLLRQIDEQQHPKSAITVREALEQWMEVADLEVTTRERYEDLIRLYIGPRLGHLQAGKLDAEILERF
jgi:hypothetical protein